MPDKFVKVIADGLKLIGVKIENEKFVSPNSQELEGKNLKDLELHLLPVQANNFAFLVDIETENIKKILGDL